MSNVQISDILVCLKQFTTKQNCTLKSEHVLILDIDWIYFRHSITDKYMTNTVSKHKNPDVRISDIYWIERSKRKSQRNERSWKFNYTYIEINGLIEQIKINTLKSILKLNWIGQTDWYRLLNRIESKSESDRIWIRFKQKKWNCLCF